VYFANYTWYGIFRNRLLEDYPGRTRADKAMLS